MSPITLLRPNAGRPARVWTPLSRDYWRLKKNTYRANLIRYFPLWEPTGSTVIDLARLGNATASNVTRGATGIGDGNQAASMDGLAGYINLYSAAFVALFNGAEFTAEGWTRASGAGVWTDGAAHEAIRFLVDANNFMYVRKSTTNNYFHVQRRASGGAIQTVAKTPFSPTTWFHWAVTISESADALKFFINGEQVDATVTGLDAWSGSLNSQACVIGAASLSDQEVWSGSFQHVSIYNAPLPDQVIKRLARAN
jgi:hypothetical protein